MKVNIDSLKEKLDEKIQPSKVCLLPSEAFVSKSFSIPEEIDSNELEEYLELLLEGISPFPVDQLLWGYWSDENAGSVLIYAAYKDRIRKLGFENLESFHHVVPSFVSCLGQIFEVPTVIYLFTESTLSALYFSANCSAPSKVISIPFIQESDIDQTKNDILDKFKLTLDNTGYYQQDFYWIGEEQKFNRDDSVLFVHKKEFITREISENAKAELVNTLVSVKRLWQTDVRELSFTEKEKKNRIKTRRIWYATLGAGIAALLLLVAQISLVILNNKNSKMDFLLTNEGRLNEILLIENKLSLQQKIEQFAQNEMRPFNMLGLINTQRPKSVYFEKALADTYNRIKIQGKGKSVLEVNQFRDKLNNLENISKVELIEINSREGKAHFIIVVTFNDYETQIEKISSSTTEKPTAKI